MLLWRRDLALAVPGEYALARCGRCGLLHQNPRVRADALADCYPDDYPRHTPEPELSSRLRRRPQAVGWLLARRLGYRHLAAGAVRWSDQVYARLFCARILGPFPPWLGAGRLLDVGCGSGRFLRQMKAVGWDVTGIEVDAAAVARARSVTSAIVVGDVGQLELAPQQFDCITVLHVLEHLPDPLGVLSKLLGWLAPGGLLIVEVPNAGGVGARVFGGYWSGLEFPRHLVHFTPATMAAMVERAGGRIVGAAHRAKPRYLLYSLAHRLSDHPSPLIRALATAVGREPVRGVLKLSLEIALPLARWLHRGEATRYFIVGREAAAPVGLRRLVRYAQHRSGSCTGSMVGAIARAL